MYDRKSEKPVTSGRHFGTQVMKLIVGTILVAAAGVTLAESGPSYSDLVEQAKRDAAAVDLKALRYAYADGENYNPYDTVEETLQGIMIKAFTEKNDCASAQKLAQEILEKNYVNIDAHMMLDLCFQQLEQPQQAKHHELMVHGLINSIIVTGDGKTPQTAFVVISIPEERSVLSMFGVKAVRQALIDVENHKIDRITVATKSGGSEDIFFNVDRPLAWLARTRKPR